ncbi:Hypothetical_protein [Hexamita inflata]|uniref:Hypothetical_protein n=1 Tax=Hexamita inflata TaxID=28002 RepID=A0AA86R9K4_9EUKA|nr:Hypothetical protein HINF_LOCUS60905 [Hexamita inflata]
MKTILNNKPVRLNKSPEDLQKLYQRKKQVQKLEANKYMKNTTLSTLLKHQSNIDSPTLQPLIQFTKKQKPSQNKISINRTFNSDPFQRNSQLIDISLRSSMIQNLIYEQFGREPQNRRAEIMEVPDWVDRLDE